MLVRAYHVAQPGAQTAGSGGELLKFEDRSQAASWAIDSLRFLTGQGVLHGTAPTVLDPRGEVSRAQAAALLSRWLDLPRE